MAKVDPRGRRVGAEDTATRDQSGSAGLITVHQHPLRYILGVGH